MEKLYYDRENKKFYVKELKTEKSGDILLVVDEQYVDVTDEIKDMEKQKEQKPNENSDKMTRYYATILVGDEYHKVGEQHTLSPYDLEYTKANGLKLKVEDGDFNIEYYRIYPCSVQVLTYKMTLIESTSFVCGGGEIKKEKVDFGDHDWKDRWS